MKLKIYRNLLFDSCNLLKVDRNDDVQCSMRSSDECGRSRCCSVLLEEMLSRLSFFYIAR